MKTLEQCKQEALKYSSRTEFRSKAHYTYLIVKIMKWDNEVFSHMVKMRKSNWSLEICREIALNFSTRSMWYKNDKSSYEAAQRYGWLRDCTLHMGPSKVKKRKVKIIETGEIFQTVAAAAKHLNTSAAMICYTIKNKRGVKGFSLEYLD